MALAVLMLILVGVSLIGVASVIFMFVLDDKIRNTTAFAIASIICFASTIYNVKSLPENMNNAIAFSYMPSVIAIFAILFRFTLNKHPLISKLLICAAIFIGIFIAFVFIK
jgi:inner membrane protein involved in colicin E2 resistance